jgi:hypothetical protein
MRRALLRRSLASLDRTLRAGRQPTKSLMEHLVRGWGNEAWSAGPPLLCAMLEWLPRTSGPIAECGSGISTLVLANAAALAGRQVHSFEHSAEWAARITRELPEHLRSSVELHLAPIRDYGEYDWYSLANDATPDQIGLVVCDGPPGGTRGGRFGLTPVLGSLMAPGCVIILDDTQRAGEHQVVRRWCSEFGASLVREGATYSVLTLGKK